MARLTRKVSEEISRGRKAILSLCPLLARHSFSDGGWLCGGPSYPFEMEGRKVAISGKIITTAMATMSMMTKGTLAR